MIPLVFLIAVVVLGLITGSFLNAVIHRLPRHISLLNPRRSFCPSCKKTIPWQENLPVVSWVCLCGRCSGCSLPIAIRYPLVELLTAGLYLFAWERFGLPLAPIYWIFLSLLVAATFIDFDHLIIPDEITLGGSGVGLFCAALLPQLMGASIWWQGLLLSLLAAALGYFLLWGVVELGKKAFGRHRVRLETPLLMELSALEKEGGSETFLKLGEETIPCEDFFYRESDRIEALCTWLEIAGERLGPGRLSIGSDTVNFEAREWAFAQLPEEIAFRAEVSELILPREAMGFGDVKFLACIGAFLGWKGVLFSLFSGSLAGALVGVTMLLATHGRSGGKIPFGPYLALGAALWVFSGPALLTLYLSLMH